MRRELHRLRQVPAEEPSLAVTSRDLCCRDTQTCRVDVRVFDIERQQRALERTGTLAESLGRTDATAAGLTVLSAGQFTRGRTAHSIGGRRWPA